MGWTDDPSALLRYQVLVALAQVEDDLLGDGEAIARSLAVEGRAVGDALDSLAGEGMVQTYERSLAAGYTTEATLTSSGRLAVERWARLRGTARAVRACASAMMDWLDVVNRPESTDEFAKDVRAYLFGSPFELEVIRSAARELKSSDLISGTGTWGGPVLRPALTPSGLSVVDRDAGSGVRQGLGSDSSASIYISNSPGAVVAAHSPGAVQVMAVGQDIASKLVSLADALEGTLPVLGLDEAQSAEAGRIAGDLREAAASTAAEPTRLRSLLERAEQIAVGGTGAATGAGIVALVQLALGAM
ncbi:hypothetical protein [Nocardioides zeae]